jgi:hypothetical protein
LKYGIETDHLIKHKDLSELAVRVLVIKPFRLYKLVLTYATMGQYKVERRKGIYARWRG